VNRRKKDIENTQDPPLSVLKERMDILTQNQILSLTLTGGEPTLRDDIHNIIEYASKHFPFVSVNTNGTFLEKLFDPFLPSNVTVLLSVRGTKKIHRMITGVNDFSSIFSKLKDINCENGRIAANFVPTSLNSQNLWELALELSRVNITTLYVSRLIRNSHLQITKEDMVRIIKVLKKIDRELRFKIRFSTPYPLCFLGDQTNPDWIKGAMCPWGSIYGGLNISGDLMPCPADSVSLGNVHQQPLRDLWKKAIFMREELDAKRLKECGGCKAKAKCSFGCIAASEENDPLVSKDRAQRLKRVIADQQGSEDSHLLESSALLFCKSFVYRQEGRDGYLVFAPGSFCGIVNGVMLELLKSMKNGSTLDLLIEQCRRKYSSVRVKDVQSAVQEMISIGMAFKGDRKLESSFS
jgi:radical SAM protein with 4Fe4S-binding SPASM domain